MAELRERAAGLSEHGAIDKKGSADAAVSKVDKGKIFLRDASVNLFCIRVAGGIVEKIHRIAGKCILQGSKKLSPLHFR